MAHFASELFVQCVYAPDLSYDGLLTLEGELKFALTAIVEKHGAEFIHFEEMGDTVRMQCVFAEFGERVAQAVCREAAVLMDGRVEARLLFVDKDMDALLFYCLSEGEWRESCLSLPPAGPITLNLRDSDDRA